MSQDFGFDGEPQEQIPCRVKDCPRTNCTSFICTMCGEHCPFPTQVFESLQSRQEVNEVVSTCGCGMTHKLTLQRGAVHDVPPGVTIDTGWKAKKNAQDRINAEIEIAKLKAEDQALIDAGFCIHCKQPLPKEGK